MTIKDVLVLLDSGSRAVEAYAISFAQRTGAHLTAVYPVLDPTTPSYAYFDAYYDISSRREIVEAAAQEGLAAFARTAIEAGAQAETQSIELPLVEADRVFARVASYFDLAIVEQANPGAPGVRDGLIEAALVGSGRPVLMVPYIQRKPASFDNVLVAWDGSAPSARALGDALPLLQSATRVEIVTVGEPSALATPPAGLSVTRHLERHGLHAQACTLPGVSDVADALLSHAADQGATLLVMGGYSHTRLRELVLGGTTKGILGSMTVPVFMAH